MSLHTLHLVQGLSHQRERLFGKSDSMYLTLCVFIGAVNVIYVIFSIAMIVLLIILSLAGNPFSSQMLDVLMRSAAVFVGAVICVLFARVEIRNE
ncbi:hypothetical protein COT30_05445 [Candidatus Micrarchaeota archaeon CG08_land_8_20_14_0_20_49_17]|nr:MAG: hypothetical protein COT30_05445 [Candidatus Micrarchaeota archaeon CG08_land_8_20_14_0_20_49_17]